MPIIGATELQPVNILGSYVQGLEAGRANQLAQRRSNQEEQLFSQRMATGQAEQRRAELQARLQGNQIIADMASSAVDQPSYEAALRSLANIGVDVSGIPPMFDPKFVAQQKQLALTEAQRIDAELKRRELGVREGTVRVQELQALTAAERENRLAAPPRAAGGGVVAPAETGAISSGGKPGPASPSQNFRTLTPEETASAGFPAGTVAQLNTQSGQIKVLSQVPAGQRPTVPKSSDPVVSRVENVANLLTKQMSKVKTGGIAGVTGALSRIFDSQDAKLFESYRQQLSGAVRAALRIPGEGALSDQEQAQYGLQLPELGQKKENNEAILRSLINQVRLAKGMQSLDSEKEDGGIDYVFENGRLIPAR